MVLQRRIVLERVGSSNTLTWDLVYLDGFKCSDELPDYPQVFGEFLLPCLKFPLDLGNHRVRIVQKVVSQAPRLLASLKLTITPLYSSWLFDALKGNQSACSGSHPSWLTTKASTPLSNFHEDSLSVDGHVNASCPSSMDSSIPEWSAQG